MITVGRGAACVLRALAAHPGLSSFAAVRSPAGEREERGAALLYSTQGLLSILQPTLLVLDPAAKPPVKEAVRRLLCSLPLASVARPSSASTPATRHLASSLLELFEAFEWRAHLPGLGATKQLPLLSRLAGGVNAWAATKDGASREETRERSGRRASRPRLKSR